MENLWHAMADSAESLLPEAHKMGATGLILEYRPGAGPLTGEWNNTFHALSFYDWDAQLAKHGSERHTTLRTQQALESLCERARAQRLSTYLMGAELNLTQEMAEERSDLSDPDGESLYVLAARRFEEILTACPHLTGILLYLDEGNAVIQELPGSRPPAERMRILLESAVQVCEKLDRKLIITTFSLMPHQARAITDALKAIPPSPKLFVHNYVCPGDWGRIALTNPAVGDCGPHPEFVAFDYCGEIWGQSVVPFVQARLMAERIAHARERGARIAGLTGYVTWADLEGDAVYEGRAIGSVNEVNLHVARRIAETGNLEPETFVREWAEAAYGADIANGLTPILLRQQDSHLAAWQLLGFWYMEWPKSRLPNLRWFEYSLHWESLAIWDPSYKEIEQQLFHPTREFVEQRILPEKDDAVDAAACNLREVRRLVEGFPSHADAEKLQELLTFFRRELLMNRALRHYTAAFFFAKLHTADDARAEAEAGAELAELLRIAEQLETNPDAAFWILEPSRLRLVANELQEVLRTKQWPAEEAIRNWTERLQAWGYEIPEESPLAIQDASAETR